MLKTTAALGCAVAAPGTLLWGVKTLTDRRFNNPSTSPRRGMYCRGMFATPLPWLKPLEGSCNNGIFCVSAYLCTQNANVNVGIMSARQHTMCDECAIGWPVHRARSGAEWHDCLPSTCLRSLIRYWLVCAQSKVWCSGTHDCPPHYYVQYVPQLSNVLRHPACSVKVAVVQHSYLAVRCQPDVQFNSVRICLGFKELCVLGGKSMHQKKRKTPCTSKARLFGA